MLGGIAHVRVGAHKAGSPMDQERCRGQLVPSELSIPSYDHIVCAFRILGHQLETLRSQRLPQTIAADGIDSGSLWGSDGQMGRGNLG